MDVNVRQELHTIIEKLTHSGAPSLDRELVKKVKSRCKLVVIIHSQLPVSKLMVSGKVMLM